MRTEISDAREAALAAPSTAQPRYLLDREGFLAPLLLLPTVVYIVALVGIPFGLAIAYSFSDATIGNQALHWVGLSNFAQMIHDPTFQTALTNTVVFTLVSQVLVVILATLLALILAEDFIGKRLVRFLVLLPWTTPVALAVVGWLWTLDSVYSPIDWVLREVHLLGPHTIFGPDTNMYWLAKAHLAQFSIIMVQTWRLVPLAAVIVLAGMTSIPRDIEDAADMDGATFWRKLVYIDLPLLLPIIAVAILFGTIFVFTDMVVVHVLTNGAPIDGTQVLANLAYLKGIQSGDLSQGAAIALFLFPVLAGLAAIMLRLARRAETV